MIRKIITIGNPVLTTVASPVNKFDRKLRSLIRDLFDTMYDAYGVGLAAPQISISLRVAVIDVEQQNGKIGIPITLINPEISDEVGVQFGEEGCLSIPGMRIELQRPNSLRVKFQDEFGNEDTLDAEGLLARAICHEVDHLDGKLITDYAINSVI